MPLVQSFLFPHCLWEKGSKPGETLVTFESPSMSVDIKFISSCSSVQEAWLSPLLYAVESHQGYGMSIWSKHLTWFKHFQHQGPALEVQDRKWNKTKRLHITVHHCGLKKVQPKHTAEVCVTTFNQNVRLVWMVLALIYLTWRFGKWEKDNVFKSLHFIVSYWCIYTNLQVKINIIII